MESLKGLLEFIFGVSFLIAGILAIANPFMTARKAKRYADGLKTNLKTQEELMNVIRGMNCILIKQAYFNESGNVEIQGKSGKHRLLLENGRIIIQKDDTDSKTNYKKMVEENAILDFIAKEEDHNLPINPVKLYKKAMRPKKIYNLAVIGVFVSVVLIVLVTVFPFGNEYVSMVKSGSPNGYPNITYEQAFGDYFSEPKWKYFRAEDGRDVVQFDGTCMYDGNTADICFQFVLDVDKGTFTTEYMGINGEAQSVLAISSVVDKVFEDYAN